jgi:hypothetical protein
MITAARLLQVRTAEAWDAMGRYGIDISQIYDNDLEHALSTSRSM